MSVLQFLDAKDTARTCLVSQAFYHLVRGHDEVLFRPHVLRQRLVSQPTPLTRQQNLAAAHTLQNALAPPGGWKGLYHVTKHLLGVPCLGYFRRVPRDFERDYRGCLLRLRPAFEGECDLDVGSNLRPTAGVGLILDVLTPSGTNRGEMNTVFVRLCEQLQTGGGVVLRGRYGGETEVHWSAHRAVSDDEDEAAASQAWSENGRIPCIDLTLEMLQIGETVFIERSSYALLSEPPSLLLPESDRDILEGLRGFWVGTYGSHGQEIIQVRFTTTTTTTTTTTSSSSITAVTAAPEAPAVAAPAAPPVIMEGLKITGDANVPANEWSFRVDVSCGPMDLAGALTADPRPVYTLDTHMGPMPRLLSQETRRIHSMYRGMGQINMVPGIWAPQEVGVDVVVLHPEENEGKGGLWVVWHDVEYTSRHCIDLTRMVETETGELNEGLEEEEEDMEA